MSEVGQQIIQGLKEALAIARGEMEAPRIHTYSAPDVAAIRKRLGLSQAKFAARFGLPLGTVRDWEQKRRFPDAPARAYLKVIDYAPETAQRAVAGE